MDDKSGMRHCQYLPAQEVKKKKSKKTVNVLNHGIFFNLPNHSSRITALGSTEPLTETSSRNVLGAKRRPARKADVSAICEPVV
jgi:hypothetical protein